MAKGFDRLRLTATAGAMGLLAGIFGASRSARAAPVSLTSTVSIVAGGVTWQVSNNTTSFDLFPQAGLGLVAATFSDFHVVDMTPSGTSSRRLNDAIDGGLVCVVNGTQFRDPTGTVDLSPVTGGQKLTSNPTTIGAFSTQMSYLFYSGISAVRAICSVTNTTGVPQALTMQISTNLGSDAATQIRGSSSNLAGTTTSVADRWFVSIEAFAAGVSPDPRLLHGRFGASAVVGPTMPTNPLDPPAGRHADQYSVTVDPGQTVSFMQFLWLNNTVAQAQGNGPTLDSLTSLQNASMLSDLSATEISQLLNYAPASVVASIRRIPTLQQGGQLLLALLVGASGLLYALRRRPIAAEKGQPTVSPDRASD